MKIVLQLFILFTIPALALSCNRHTTSNTVQIDQSEAAEIALDEPQSELCRVVVNYKNNRHHYVEFGKNGFKPIDAQGTLVKLDDEWGIISIAKFQFADQRITSNEFILRMMNANSDLLYQIRRPMRILDNGYYGYKTWNHFCLPYAYHEALTVFSYINQNTSATLLNCHLMIIHTSIIQENYFIKDLKVLKIEKSHYVK